MAMSNPAKDLKGTRLNAGKWRGYVVDRNDPEKRQRVKIRIPQLHRGIPDSQLPWSMPTNGGQANAGGGVGTVAIPAKGALVEGFFEEDDPHNFRFTGSPPVDSVNKDNELLGEDYPYTEGSIDESGNRTSVNRLRNEILIHHTSGASIFIDGAGNISLNAKGKLTLNGAQGVDVTGGGTINMHSGEKVDSKGGPIFMNSSGPKLSSSSPSSRSTPSIPSASGKTNL